MGPFADRHFSAKQAALRVSDVPVPSRGYCRHMLYNSHAGVPRAVDLQKRQGGDKMAECGLPFARQ